MKETFLGVPADIVTLEEAVDRVRAMLSQNRPHFLASINPEICVASQQNSSLRATLLAADLGLPDGVGIVLASRLRGGRLRQRVTGIDFLQALCALAAREGKSVFFFGGADGVAAAAAANMAKQYPGLQVAGTQHGYIKPAEEEAVAVKIAAAAAQIVFVGLGSPRQELFVALHGEATAARVLMVVGGAFDVLSGRLPRAPHLYRRLGAEWLYRLFMEPRRWSRVLSLPRFLVLAVIKKN